MVNYNLITEYLSEKDAPSPLQTLQDERWQDKGVELLVKRDDVLRWREGGAWAGNKWRKLKYNLLEASRLQQSTLLTFGGAYSNHLAAVAEAGQVLGFQTIGIVRGEEALPLNPTLQFCREAGMHLHYMDRATYRRKKEPNFGENLQREFGKFYLLPEGGTNALALQGCAELAAELKAQLGHKLPSHCAVACGTGGTLAGLAQGFRGSQSQVMGFAVLKGDFLKQEVGQFLDENDTHWHIQNAYHSGGYAKFSSGLIDFIRQFKIKFDIPLDPVYTGKLFYGLFDLINKDFFPPGSRVVAIHTGGLQGIAGFNRRYGTALEA